MSPLFGPILAQLVTLGVADRTEGRYVVSDSKYFEAATSPQAGLSFGWKHTTLSLGYGASITVTPLDSKPRDVLVFHTAVVAASYRWRRTTVTLSESVGYGEVNFQRQAVAGGAVPVQTPPADPNGMPTSGTTTPGNTNGTGTNGTGTQNVNLIRAQAGDIRYATSNTNLDVTQKVSPVLSVSGDVGYVISGSVGHQDQPNAATNYPLVKGPRAQATATYKATRQDDLASTLSIQYAGTSTGSDASLLLANETWGHAFDARTSSRLGVGIAGTRNWQPGGPVTWSIYPTFNAGLMHSSSFARGTLSYGVGINSSPAIDPVRGYVDPRLGFNALAGWTRERFSSNLNAGTSISIAEQNSNGAFSNAAGAFTIAYHFGKVVSADSGIRAAWQSYEGQTTLPFTWAAFVGLTFVIAAPLNGGR